MNWEDLRYILAVAREGTLLAGAKALGVSPTTVARRLRSLEADHGASLFDKFRHGAVLSEAGQRVVSVAKEVERLTDLLDAEIHGLDQKLAGSIRVTSVEFLLRHWVRDFGEFKRRYPKVDLELTSSLTVANLTQREADVALRVASSAPEHLLGAKYAEFHYAVYAGKGLADAVGADAPYGEFPWLSWDLAVSHSTDRWIANKASGAEIVMRVSSMGVMVEAVAAGVGASMLPCLVGDPHPALQRVGDYFQGGLFLWVLTHPQLRGSSRISAFTKFVRALIQRDKNLIEGSAPHTAGDDLTG